MTPEVTRKKTLECPRCKSKILVDEVTNVDVICNMCGSRFIEL